MQDERKIPRPSPVLLYFLLCVGFGNTQNYPCTHRHPCHQSQIVSYCASLFACRFVRGVAVVFADMPLRAYTKQRTCWHLYWRFKLLQPTQGQAFDDQEKSSMPRIQMGNGMQHRETCQGLLLHAGQSAPRFSKQGTQVRSCWSLSLTVPAPRVWRFVGFAFSMQTCRKLAAMSGGPSMAVVGLC